MPDLGKIFNARINNDIRVALQTAEDLTKLVGAGAFPADKPLSLTLTAPQPDLDIFNTPVKLGASVTGTAQIAAADAKFQPFGDDTDLIAPDKNAYARLAIEAKLDGSASGGGNAGSVAISGEATATASMSYEHLLPVPLTETRLAAFTNLVTTTQLPQLADLPNLREGEALCFDALFNFDLGIKAKYGAALDISDTIDVASDLTFPVKAHAEFTVNAALGLGVHESMRVVVAKAGQRNGGWVRMRFTRTHRNRITFGAAFTLAVQYDATQGATMLLDKTFAQLQMPKAVADLREIVVQIEQPWSTIKSQLTAKAVDAVTTLVGNTGWQQWLDNSEEVKAFTTGAQWIVKSYDGLEEKVKSVWEELLARLDATGFEKVRTRIHELATLDINSIDIKKLTSGQLDRVIDLIELFSGKDIEELVLTGDIKTGLEKAIALAKKVDAMIQDASKNRALELMQGYAQRTGIAKVVEWLRARDTVAELQKAADTWIQSTVERLTGKLLSQVNEDDVARLQKFAAKVQKLIEAPQVLEAKLRKAVAKLKGEFTVSLSIEISRVSESTALVDLEIDPSNKTVLDAATRFLPSGNVQQLLTRLDAIDAGKDQKAPYDIRELVLTSRHIRTSTATLFFSFLGSIKSEKSQVRESTIRIEGGGDVPKKRTGLYNGGVVVRRTDDAINTEGAAWLRVEATGSGLDVEQPYDELRPSIRLTYVREDVKTTDEEIASMVAILGDVGFDTGATNFPQAGVSARFAMELELPAAAVAALVRDVDRLADFDRDVRNAGARWFDDRAIAPDAMRRIGKDMAAVIRSDAFPPASGDPQDLNDAARRNLFPVNIWDTTTAPQRIRNEYFRLVTFDASRTDPWHRRYVAFQPLDAPQTHDAVERMIRQGVDMFSTASVDWQIPLFNFWLVLSRLSRLSLIGPDVLRDAKGVATLRTRASSSAPWGDPLWFTLSEGMGIGAQGLRNRAFPI